MRMAILISMFFVTFNASAIEDTVENRITHGERYLAAAPPQEIIQEMANAMSMNLPPNERQEIRDLLIKFVDAEAVSEIMMNSMIRTFTAEELATLADFSEHPLAKSIMKKLGTYLADAMPSIQAEVMRAIGQMEEATAAENRMLPDLEE
ncbi:MAG: DUF2059 domain-containing protein [Pseudomonadota bacterium]